MKYERMLALLKCLLGAYVVTGVLLLVTAGLLYKFNLSEKAVDIGIIAIYVISSLLAGLFYAKGASGRKFLWGMGAGTAYFLILSVLSMILEQNYTPLSNSCITTLLICLGSGMLGGMLG